MDEHAIDKASERSLQELPEMRKIDEFEHESPPEYRLYRRRWAGLVAMCLLNIAGGMNWLWFSAIALETKKEFSFSITQVNWLSNSVNLIYLPVSCLIPVICQRYGVRVSCMIGAGSLFLASWLRFAGTARSLSPGGSYTLIFLAQCLAGVGQPFPQVLAPRYSELWFDLGGRITATMIASLGNPVGSALAQLLSPMVGGPRQSVLVLAIITSLITPSVFLIGNAPPTPPTFSGSQKSPSVLKGIQSFLGSSRFGKSLGPGDVEPMERAERVDFWIILVAFGVFTGIMTTFSILVNQILAPHGYSSDAAGIMGAALFLSGLLAAIVFAPLFDRVFTHHLAVTVRCILPTIAAAWLGLVFAVKRGGTAGIYVCLIIAGVGSFTLLPVALELACEVTRNPEASSAALWFSANMFSVAFVLIEQALTDGPNASPPLNMRKSLIFQGSVAFIAASLVLLLRGKQARRERDMQAAQRAADRTS